MRILLALAGAAPLATAGGCLYRIRDDGRVVRFHDRAPRGVSHCHVCGRHVLRGAGRWWADE